MPVPTIAISSGNKTTAPSTSPIPLPSHRERRRGPGPFLAGRASGASGGSRTAARVVPQLGGSIGSVISCSLLNWPQPGGEHCPCSNS